MACQDCNNPSGIPSYVSLPGCPSTFIGCDNNCANGIYDTACIVYTGPDLNCIGATTNTCLESIITQINSKVCTAVGDYSIYNLGCLRDDYIIDTAQDFAESISNYVCTLRADYNQFVNTTYLNDLSNIQDQIDNIQTPDTTSNCSNVVIPPDSGIQTVLQILSNASCSLYSAIDPSSANWSQCFTVIDPPLNIVDAFNVVLDQICQINSSTGAVLPTFNNVGTCLPSPGATDTLSNTIIKIRTRLCQTPTFDAANLNGGYCGLINPSDTLETVIDSLNQALTITGSSAVTSASSDFIIDYVDPFNPCLGKTISLNTSVIDRSVALNDADIAPGNLSDKIAAGANITLDFGTINTGKLTITSTGGITADEKVKSRSSDPTPGYLDQKLIGASTTYITNSIVPANATQLKVQGDLNLYAIATDLLALIDSDDTLRTIFCTLINTCPSPCDAPTNVQVTYIP